MPRVTSASNNTDALATCIGICNLPTERPHTTNFMIATPHDFYPMTIHQRTRPINWQQNSYFARESATLALSIEPRIRVTCHHQQTLCAGNDFTQGQHFELTLTVIRGFLLDMASACSSNDCRYLPQDLVPNTARVAGLTCLTCSFWVPSFCGTALFSFCFSFLHTYSIPLWNFSLSITSTSSFFGSTNQSWGSAAKSIKILPFRSLFEVHIVVFKFVFFRGEDHHVTSESRISISTSSLTYCLSDTLARSRTIQSAPASLT